MDKHSEKLQLAEKSDKRASCQSTCATKQSTPAIALNEKDQLASTFGQSQLQKVAQHPCYSNDAHHKYARMHLAVAPACNIQCNYCNRKYDCANESRPGVVSELLSPEQALLKAQAVAQSIPQLSVIGIAGPGDPLANPERTFKTLALIRDAMPDIKLCLSTNGLMLSDYIDEIVNLGVDHVTITINTLDPDVAAKIYKWVYFEGKRYTGIEAGKLLIQRQLQGLADLQKVGILTKVNSVLIPEINDTYLPALSQQLRDNNVFLHNIMALISQPEHGTEFGLTGQREPTEKELDEVRELAGGNVSQMKHCQQCRADAVGMLGEDRSNEFNLQDITTAPDYQQTMLSRSRFQSAVISNGVSETEASFIVAIASNDNDQIGLHFGHANCFKLYLISATEQHYIGERRIKRYCSGSDECHDQTHDDILQKTINALQGVDLVLSVRIGDSPLQLLKKANIESDTHYAYHGVPSVLPELFAKYKQLALSKWEQQKEELA